jgi:hypothetical protein
MKFIAKYGIGIYLIVTLLFKLNFIIPYAFTNILYQILMVMGILLFFSYSKVLFQGKRIRFFRFLYLILVFNLIFLLFFDLQEKSLLYVLAKFSTTNLIVFGVLFNYSFYERFFKAYFKYVLGLMLVLGYLLGQAADVSAGVQRMEIGFNPNDVGLFGALAVLSIMVFNPLWYKNKKDLILLLVFMLLTLLSGSKAALLNLIVGTILVYGFSFKIFAFALSLSLILAIAPKLGYTTSVDRLMSKERAFETRDEVFEIGLLTFHDSFWIGHGLDKYGWTDPKYWPSAELALGPHSTYLSIGIMYGVVFGTLFILLLFRFLIKSLKLFYRFDNPFLKFCVLVIVLCLVNGFFESLIVAVNEFITLLFWFAAGIICFYGSNKKLFYKQIGI